MNLHGHVTCVQREVGLQANRVDLDDREEVHVEVVGEVLESLLQVPVRRFLNTP